MCRTYPLLALASFWQLIGVGQESKIPIEVQGTTPFNTSAPIPEAFLSYSIEFAFFPDFAGMIPNATWKKR
jgi:hypothetical protein